MHRWCKETCYAIIQVFCEQGPRINAQTTFLVACNKEKRNFKIVVKQFSSLHPPLQQLTHRLYLLVITRILFFTLTWLSTTLIATVNILKASFVLTCRILALAVEEDLVLPKRLNTGSDVIIGLSFQWQTRALSKRPDFVPEFVEDKPRGSF